MQEYLTDDQLKERLVAEYARENDNDVIAILRQELYTRGYQRHDIIELALAALWRRFQNAKEPVEIHLN